MKRRHIEPLLLESLSDTPVVLVNGARQTGKSTLVQGLARTHPATYVTLDDFSTLAAARDDPEAFVSAQPGPLVLDEVQRVPNLLLAIKRAVDLDRRPGRFLLTGSANIRFLPNVADSLAGRMEVHTLRPFSQGEIAGVPDGFVDTIFGSDESEIPNWHIEEAVAPDTILAGGYPEALRRLVPRRRRAWFGAYVESVLQREVKDIADIAGLTDLPRLLALIASRTTSITNAAEIARTAGLAHTTVRRYLSLLRAIYLIDEIPAWSSNRAKRLIRSPKLILTDTGVAAHLIGASLEQLQLRPHLLGPLLENFVAVELLKQLSWSQTRAQLFHYRTHGGREVDFVLEEPGGRVVGLEVKWSSTVSPSDLKGLTSLEEDAGDAFFMGIVLYRGSRSIVLGPRKVAVPIGALWTPA
jgi:uncharacterized protein